MPRSFVVKFLNIGKRGILFSLIRKPGWKQYNGTQLGGEFLARVIQW